MPREVLWISANVKALQERSPLAPPPRPPFLRAFPSLTKLRSASTGAGRRAFFIAALSGTHNAQRRWTNSGAIVEAEMVRYTQRNRHTWYAVDRGNET